MNTRRVRAGHPAMNNTEYLKQIAFKQQADTNIEASQKAFMDSCEQVEFAGEEPWTFTEWLISFLIGAFVLVLVAGLLLDLGAL